MGSNITPQTGGKSTPGLVTPSRVSSLSPCESMQRCGVAWCRLTDTYQYTNSRKHGLPLHPDNHYCKAHLA